VLAIGLTHQADDRFGWGQDISSLRSACQPGSACRPLPCFDLSDHAGQNELMSHKDLVDPENVLRDVLDREFARLEAQYAEAGSVRDRFRFRRAKRRLIREHGRGRWFANW
jgi:hypothetical protein